MVDASQTVKKWSIYWIMLDPVAGSEQAGIRPCLVVSNDIVNDLLPVITVLPLSSVRNTNRIYPTEVFLAKNLSTLPKDSVVMVHQIRTIAKQRIRTHCGWIDDNFIRVKINDVMRSYFEI